MHTEVPQVSGTFQGVPMIRVVVFGGIYWGPAILGNYHMYSYDGKHPEVPHSQGQHLGLQVTQL